MEDTVPNLQKKEEFKKIIKDYRLSAHGQSVLRNSRLVVLLGVAGGGRNTLINYLINNGPYYFIVSDTTRPPKVRDGQLEKNGQHYFFRTEDDFLKDLKNGEYVEAEIIHDQQVSGTSVREIQVANQRNLIGIHDFDVLGATNIKKLKPDAFIVGLLPPSFDEWQKRLNGREQMHNKEFINRMKTAVIVLNEMLKKPYFKFIISDDVRVSSGKLQDLVERGHYTEQQHQQGISIARSMLKNTKKLIQE